MKQRQFAKYKTNHSDYWNPMSTEVEKVWKGDCPIRQRDANKWDARYCTNEWKIGANEKETEKTKVAEVGEMRREIEMNKNK